MIYLELKGRLGNQFFRYAFARMLQIKRGNNEKLVLGLSNMSNKNPNDGWCDSLKDFNVISYDTCTQRLVYKYGTFFQKIIDSLFFVDLRLFARNIRAKRIIAARKWLHFLAKNGLIHMVEEYYDVPLPSTENVIIDGGFQASKYFNEIRPLLLKEFIPKHKLLPENKELYEKIVSSNSICISIRRGDYVSVAEYNKIYNICSKDYFEKAVDIIKRNVANPVFVVFSDDIQWAKENLDFGGQTYYERGVDPLWEKVRLMSACRHFIISNSSFSWMVQYHGTAKDKIVVSPDRWYNGTEYPCYLIEDNFIKIKV